YRGLHRQPGARGKRRHDPTAFQRAARAARRTDRALSRLAIGASADGLDLPARGGPCGALGARELQRHREGAGRRHADPTMGPERQGAHLGAADLADDERQARLDTAARRRLPGAAARRARRGAAAAGPRRRRGPFADDRAAEGDEDAEVFIRRTGHHQWTGWSLATAHLLDRDRQPGSLLRADLRSGRGLWRLALCGLSAVLLVSARLRRQQRVLVRRWG